MHQFTGVAAFSNVHGAGDRSFVVKKVDAPDLLWIKRLRHQEYRGAVQASRRRRQSVNLFDDIGRRDALNEPDGAKETAISHDAHHFSQISDISQRITVNDKQVSSTAGRYTAKLQAEIEIGRCIYAGAA